MNITNIRLKKSKKSEGAEMVAMMKRRVLLKVKGKKKKKSIFSLLFVFHSALSTGTLSLFFQRGFPPEAHELFFTDFLFLFRLLKTQRKEERGTVSSPGQTPNQKKESRKESKG